jgi:hypothetical protein
MERKLGVKWFGGGSAALLYFEREGPMAQLRQAPGSTPPTQLHEPFMGCLQLGDVDSLENGQMEARTVGFSIRNPLAGDSMQRSLHQTPSDLTMDHD